MAVDSIARGLGGFDLGKIKSALTGIASAVVQGTSIIITFNNGDTATITFPQPADGVGVQSIAVDTQNHLLVTYTDGTIADAGEIKINGYTNLGVKAGLGGVKAGTVFNNTPFSEVFDMLFKPPYTKPSVSVSLDCNLLYDPLLNDLNDVTITANITKGTEEIKTVRYYIDGVLVNTITDPTTISPSYTYHFSTPQKETFVTRVEVEDTTGTTSKVSAEKKVEFWTGCRYGSVNDGIAITPSVVGSLTYQLRNNRAGTFTISATYGKAVIAYPKEMGMYTAIRDLQNNINYTDSFTSTIMTINGYDYIVAYLKESAGFENVPYTVS